MKAKIIAMMLFFSVSTKSRGQIDRTGKRQNIHEVREHNHVLELARQPYQVERVLVDRDLVGQGGRIVAAQPRAAVRVDADAEVADARLQVGAADDVADGRVDVVVDLRRVGHGRVVLVVDGEEEDVGHQRGGGGAAC